jgi:hypothetical protein
VLLDKSPWMYMALLTLVLQQLREVVSRWVCDKVVMTSEIQVSHIAGNIEDSDKAVACRQ